MLFSIWESVFGPAAPARLRRVANLNSLQGFGADLARVDAVATPATFGPMCPGQTCAGVPDFNSATAPFAYAGYSVDQVLDVLRSTVLAAEVGWNQAVKSARVGAPEREVLGYTAGPRVQAGYGWRNTWTGVYGAGGCQSCLWAQMGVKLGAAGLARRTGPDGWVVQESWNCTAPGAYPPAAGPRNASAGRRMAGTPEECKAACAAAAAAACAGFSYHEDNRTCFFLASVVAMGPPGSALPSNSPNLGALGTGAVRASCYSRAAPAPAVSAEAAWAACSGRCGRPPFWAVAPLGWADLDRLADLALNVTQGAQLEQALEDALHEANGHPRMQGSLLDALERWRRVAGGGAVCMPPLDYTPGRWWPQSGFVKDPVDIGLRRSPLQRPAPKLQAVRAWLAGDPLILPFTGPGPEGSGGGPEAGSGGVGACQPACAWGLCVNGSCLCFPGYAGPDCAAASAERPANECQGPGVAVGTNVAGFSYWSTQWDYVDVFKKSGLGDTSGNRGWLAQRFGSWAWDTKEPLNISLNGYPAELAPTSATGRLMIRDLQRHGVSGVYTVLWDGDGTVACSMDDVQRVWRPRPGRLDVLVQLSLAGNNGLFLRIERTNPADPVRKIRVLTPGFGSGGGWGGYRGSPFHPAFVETMRRYRVLRFMEWQAGGGGPGSWAQRPQRSDPSYVTNGAPLEDMLLLANLVGADAWFCLPYLADDDYVRSFAEMVRAGLRPDRKAYIEYSNELWHTGFAGGQYVDARGSAMGLGRLCYAVARMRNISRIFRGVFGPEGRGRFVTVVSTQLVAPDATRQILACSIGAPGEDIDALALAPYFDGFAQGLPDVPSILAGYAAGINASLALVRAHASLTAQRGFALLTYEAGPGSPVGSLSDLGIAAHRESGMRALIRQYYEGLAMAGVGLLMHFTSTGAPTKYGAWGLLETTDQDPATAYKREGLFDFMDAHAACALPPRGANDRGECGGHGYFAGGEGGGTGCLCYYGYSGERCELATYTEHKSCGFGCTFDQAPQTLSPPSAPPPSPLPVFPLQVRMLIRCSFNPTWVYDSACFPPSPFPSEQPPTHCPVFSWGRACASLC